MTRLALAALVLGGLGSMASANEWAASSAGHNDVYAATTQVAPTNGYACDHCCGSWGMVGEAELLLFKYNRADGVRIGDGAGESASFDYNAGYRLMAGVVAPSGLGTRVRYFAYDHFEEIEDAGDGLFIDTYTIDFELFETFQVSECWSLEASGGIRYVGFEEEMVDAAAGDFRRIDMDGIGLVAGLEARRAILRSAAFYTRTRLAAVEGDKHVLNTDGLATGQDIELTDVTAGMLEIAVGLEAQREMASGSVLFARTALEWQNWWNFSNSFAGGPNGEALFDGPSDVGFSGITFSLGVAY